MKYNEQPEDRQINNCYKFYLMFGPFSACWSWPFVTGLKQR